MALTDEQEKQLEELFKVKLKEQYNRGLHVGILSVSKVVLDKLNDGSKPFMKRIEDVKKFCSTPWNKQKQIEKALKDTQSKAEQSTENSDTSAPSGEDNGENTVESGEN